MTVQLTTQVQQNHSRQLIFRIHFLLERYHGKEWPPSPRKLFLAFVAALYQGRGQRVKIDEGEKALEYLESKSPPAIQARGIKGTEYKLFVPNNYRDLESKEYKKGKIPTIDPKVHNTEKIMRPYITDTIQYIWEIDDYDENEKNIQVLCRLANEIPVLGLGIDPVAIHGEITNEIPYLREAEYYVKDEDSDDIRITVPVTGLLGAAKKHYNEFITRIIKDGFVKPKPITKYHSQKYRKEVQSADIITFKIIDSNKMNRIISEEDVPKMIERLNELKTVVSQDPNNQEIKTVILPSIGGKHSDSLNRRIGFILSPGVSKTAKESIIEKASNMIIEISGQKYQLDIIVGNKDGVQNTYTDRSRLWSSVTQLDLDIKNNSTRQDITKAILDALKKEKIDEEVTFVNFRKEPYWNDIPITSKKMPMYAEIEFRSSIKYPFVIGNNQKLGHGLFAPSRIPDSAYFTVLGTRPPIEKTIMVGDLMRRSVMSKLKNTHGSQFIPSNISGHDEHGNSLRDNHRQAYWLPIDTDNDGLIDHIVVYVSDGFDKSIQESFSRIRELHNNEGLRLSVFFKGFHNRDSLDKKYSLFRKQKEWVSITPYFMPWHIKKGYEMKDQVKKECKNHWKNNNILRIDDHAIQVGNRKIATTSFENTRNQKKPINAVGQAIKLSFDNDVRGPVVLGACSHFGLGMFVPADTS